MAVKIRLSRTGKRNDPKYRIIVIEEGKKRDGRYIDKLGFYDPMKDPFIFQLDWTRMDEWIKKGAQVSEGLGKIIRSVKKR